MRTNKFVVYTGEIAAVNFKQILPADGLKVFFSSTAGYNITENFVPTSMKEEMTFLLGQHKLSEIQHFLSDFRLIANRYPKVFFFITGELVFLTQLIYSCQPDIVYITTDSKVLYAETLQEILTIHKAQEAGKLYLNIKADNSFDGYRLFKVIQNAVKIPLEFKETL